MRDERRKQATNGSDPTTTTFPLSTSISHYLAKFCSVTTVQLCNAFFAQYVNSFIDQIHRDQSSLLLPLLAGCPGMPGGVTDKAPPSPTNNLTNLRVTTTSPKNDFHQDFGKGNYTLAIGPI